MRVDSVHVGSAEQPRIDVATVRVLADVHAINLSPRYVNLV